MASAPFQLGQVAPPQPCAVLTGESGAAVQGSSALFQAADAGRGGAAPLQPIQAQQPWQPTSHSTAWPSGAGADTNASGPGPGSYPQHDPSWHQTDPYANHAARPLHAPWQHQHQQGGYPPSYNSHYHQYDYSQQQYQYPYSYPYQYAQQHPYTHHQAWSGYQSYTPAAQGPAVAADAGGSASAAFAGAGVVAGAPDGATSCDFGGQPTIPPHCQYLCQPGGQQQQPGGQQQQPGPQQQQRQQQPQGYPQQKPSGAFRPVAPEAPSTATAAATSALGTAGVAVAAADDLYDPLADADPAPMVTSAAAVISESAAAIAPNLLAEAASDAFPAAELSAARHPAGGCGPDGTAAAINAAAPVAVPAPPPAVDLIVVWDLDETLIIFNSLLSGAFTFPLSAVKAAKAEAAAAVAAAATAAALEGADGPPRRELLSGPAGFPPEPSEASELRALTQRAAALGRDLAELVFSFCDDHLAFKKFEEMDPVSFMELWSSVGGGALGAPGAAAAAIDRATLERIAEVYGGGAEGLADVLGEAGCRTRVSMLAEAERLTGGWVAAGRLLLAGVTAAAAASTATASHQPVVLGFRSVRHILVSAGHLIATLGKLLLWGLDEFFDIRDVYSASGRPKLEIFRALRARFGPTVAYAAVGDGKEEERAAAVMGWGFVRVGPLEAGARAALQTASAAGVGVGFGGSASLPRPIISIQPQDVLEAARAAY